MRQDDNALLHVSDTGMGIPEDALSHIFERFYRVDKSHSKETGGTGLGLSITRLIVEKLGGKIWVDTSYKTGARFVFTHPL